MADQFDAFVRDATEQLRTRLRAANAATHPGPWEAAQAFAAAIDWHRDRWLWALGSLHCALWLAALRSRSDDRAQAALFLAALAGVAGSERLNALAARHWPRFATQNYFDARGVFAGCLWAGPLLALAAALLLGFLARAAGLLVRVKRAQLRARARTAKEE